jgi:hypothetical protein
MTKMLRRGFVRALIISLVAVGAVRVAALRLDPQPQTPPPQGQTPPAQGGAGAQGTTATPPAPAPAPAPRAMSPEQKAYTDAVALSDPAEKLAALRKVQADFPASSFARTADSAILDVYLASWPEKTNEIATLVDTVVANTPATAAPEVRFSALVAVATKLVDKKVMLDRAEALVAPALAGLDMGKYVAAQKAGAAPNNFRTATDAQMETSFKAIRARGEELLGRIAFEKGDLDRAAKFFKDGLADSAVLPRAPIALAEIEVKRGNDKAALEYYMMPAVQGKLKPEEDLAFRALYTKVHGSVAGLDKDLDKFYDEKFPNPVKAEKYVPKADATNRLVLVEMFTGSGCPPCVAADLALEGVLERYPAATVATLAYHENIPQPDPMVVPGAVERFAYYKPPPPPPPAQPQSWGVPTIVVDGKFKVGGGAREGAPNTYADYVRRIDAALAAPAKASIALRASLEGSKVKVTVTVSKVADGARDARVQLVLTEHQLRFTGENGIRFHDEVVRAIAGDARTGMALNATGDTTIEYVFDLAALPDEITRTLEAEMVKRHAPGRPVTSRAEGHPMTTIDPSALSVVAFVQNGDKDVWQAAHTDVATPATKAGKGGK